MKKSIIILFIISLGFLFSNSNEEIIIPEDAIRFRIIANSNSAIDQKKKTEIKNQIEEKIYDCLTNVNNVKEARKLIKENLDVIEEIVKEYQIPYQINYGQNYFPTKTYKGIIYPSGNYESLVITLGKGIGKNFWCVLFPPLCLIDNESKEYSDIEYQSYIKNLLARF